MFERIYRELILIILHNTSPETCCSHFFEETDFFKSTRTDSIKNLITGEKHLLRTSLLLFSTPRCCFKGGSKNSVWINCISSMSNSPSFFPLEYVCKFLSSTPKMIDFNYKCFPKSTLHNAFQARRHFESRNSPNLLKTSLTSQQQVSQDEKAENRIKLGSGHMYCEEKH